MLVVFLRHFWCPLCQDCVVALARTMRAMMWMRRGRRHMSYSYLYRKQGHFCLLLSDLGYFSYCYSYLRFRLQFYFRLRLRLRLCISYLHPCRPLLYLYLYIYCFSYSLGRTRSRTESGHAPLPNLPSARERTSRVFLLGLRLRRCTKRMLCMANTKYAQNKTKEEKKNTPNLKRGPRARVWGV
ncbi:hypothetical protein FB451DRAFT_1414166 [Mycena latifolia]|nr:hypothetical protein FB451DRAFT_1414166 [Mycena latifolia]